MMKTEQYVMAYGVEQDRLRAILPEGFSSLRPVLRINAEIRDDENGYVEFNTAVEKDGNKGWLNIEYWNGVNFEKSEKTVTFRSDFLEISFTAVGVEGACPAEKDNDGCYFIGKSEMFKAPEIIKEKKEFCECGFKWKFSKDDAQGVSSGKSIPAYPTDVINIYPKEEFTAENAAKISCNEVLGSYVVKFER